jgi:glycosyltransferase involved in cell wall biosynthesis
MGYRPEGVERVDESHDMAAPRQGRGEWKMVNILTISAVRRGRASCTSRSVVMRALLFDYMPVDHRGAGGPSTLPLVGSTVYRAEVARAVLRYGSFDRYYFVQQRGWSQSPEIARTLPASLGDRSRARAVGATELASLVNEREMVLFSPGPDLFHLLPMRVLLQQHQWPLFGITHSLNGRVLGLPLLSLLLDDYGPHDVLVCTSAAGKRAIERQLASHRDALAIKTGARLDTPVRMPIIPLGIDPEPFQDLDREAARAELGLAGDRVVILYFGRFSALTKGDLLPLLLAFRDVHATQPKASLVLAGDDTQSHLAQTLAAQAGVLGLAPCVRIAPDPSDAEKRTWFAAADIFVAISDNLQETFGITVAEAMMAGRPVIAADWNGYRDLIAHGRTGCLVPTCGARLGVEIDILSSSGNWMADQIMAETTTIDVDALTAHLTTLVETPALRARLGQEAQRDAMRRFAWREIVAQYEALWIESLQRGATRAGRRTHDRGGVLHYSYEDAFGHYPTRWLEDDDRLTVVRRPSDAETTALEWSALGEAMFSPRVMTGILDELRSGGPLSLAELLRRMTADGAMPEFVARAHIGRLAKYGLLAAAPIAQPAAQPAG